MLDKLLIRSENENGPTIVLIIDDHCKHIMGHLPYFWKPRIIRHILRHLWLWFMRDKHIPSINLEDIIRK